MELGFGLTLDTIRHDGSRSQPGFTESGKISVEQLSGRALFKSAQPWRRPGRFSDRRHREGQHGGDLGTK